MRIFKLSEKELEVYLKKNIDTKKPNELLEELIECGLESGGVMEEDIKIVEEFIESSRNLYDSSRFSEGIRYLGQKEYKAIENLINKYKEQKNEQAFEKSEFILEQQHKIEEQEKAIKSLTESGRETLAMINLMTKFINKTGIHRRAYNCVFRNGECDEYSCEHCIKDYFKKKAREK